MTQIALVSYQHDHNVAVCVIAKLLEPSGDILVCLVLADIVYKESSDSAAIVSGGDGTITLLSGGIPDLSLDCFGIHLDAASRELNSDGGLGIQVEFVAGESREKVGLSNTGVSNEDNCRDKLAIVRLLRCSVGYAAMSRFGRAYSRRKGELACKEEWG